MENSLIEQMQNSDNELFKAEAKTLMQFKDLKHVKSDLETLLNNCVVELDYKTNDSQIETITCTSNMLLKYLLDVKTPEQKRKVISSYKNKGIHTRDKKSVLTWDINERKFKTVNISKYWEIKHPIYIDKENVLVLDKILREILKI